MQKKKVLSIVMASTLAATLVAGAGTFAYLQANTGTITNRFGKAAEGEDYLLLKLEETGVTLDEQGNGEKSYTIKAGEQDDKDPTVTVTNTIDVFTFVEISDKTTLEGQKLVKYAIDNGWTELAGIYCADENVTDIFYRIVPADADNKIFSVIDSDKINYAGKVTKNEINENDVTLAFQAHCIQTTPYITENETQLGAAIAAYKQLDRAVDYEPEENFNTYDNEDGTVNIYSYNGSNSVVNIPPTIDGMTVVKIGNNAFRENETITKVTIPSTVTEVEVGAFSKTPNLTQVKISKNLTNLWGSAFKESGLTDITIPAGVKTLTDSCLSDNPNLVTVNMTEGLEEIGNNVFANCTSLKTVFLPEGLTKLSGAAFNGCTSLESVTIPESVTDFGESFNFEGCDLTKLTIRGVAGSPAQTYAENNGIKFEAIS